jgi:hypothetical protein
VDWPKGKRIVLNLAGVFSAKIGFTLLALTQRVIGYGTSSMSHGHNGV